MNDVLLVGGNKMVQQTSTLAIYVYIFVVKKVSSVVIVLTFK